MIIEEMGNIMKPYACASNEPHKRYSIHTLFGQDSSLHRINEKLYEHRIEIYGQLETITEAEFWEIIGRTTPKNKEKIQVLFRDFPICFRAAS